MSADGALFWSTLLRVRAAYLLRRLAAGPATYTGW